MKHIENEIKVIKETEHEIAYMIRSGFLDENFAHENTKKMTMAFVNKRIRKMEDIVSVIKKTYDESSEEQQQVIKLRYWSNKNLTWDGIALELNMHRNTAINYKNDFIILVAKRLGWM
ncbi:hypothetical protein [Shouchella miscanthi]|uniref:Transcriptional regulator n=1 Tax=Shouchella miscanthi TaxID=2598861 RepID=A0ABU6NJW2_9BACI|nr:hypothetical protein [Shouchella miscanthi]